jgi:glycosyltransferase involved in cell wall biosynthesis
VTLVLLVHQPIDGGVGRHVRDLATGLTDRGYEIVVCGPARLDGIPDCYRHVRLDLQRALAPRPDLIALVRFAKLVRALRPGLVHAHSSKAGAIARLDRLLDPGVPVIYTPHGYAFAGHFSREIERSAYRAIEGALARLTSRVVCVCEAEARLARTVGPVERVRVVYNGIEQDGGGPIQARMNELARRGPVICALTLLRPGKGIETLIDAAPRILARHPNTQIAIGGGGPDIELLRSRTAQRGIASAVHFLGPTADPLSVLRGATLFVHPSWAESFPYVVLEAMSVGLPIVASDVGGIPEALVDGESGLLVAPGDEQALAAALLGLLEDTARATRMGRAAKRRVEQRFSRQAMIAGLGEVYDEVLTPRGPPSRL